MILWVGRKHKFGFSLHNRLLLIFKERWDQRGDEGHNEYGEKTPDEELNPSKTKRDFFTEVFPKTQLLTDRKVESV